MMGVVSSHVRSSYEASLRYVPLLVEVFRAISPALGVADVVGEALSVCAVLA